MIKLKGNYENTIKVHYDEENEGVEINMSFFIANQDIENFNGKRLQQIEEEYTRSNSSKNREEVDNWVDWFEEECQEMVRLAINSEIENNSYTAIVNEDCIDNFDDDEELIEETNKYQVADKLADLIQKLEQMRDGILDN